ncbi:MAG TPA: extracellular solute-binding protein, partial [Paenibacillus sp.]|nr:extracellular solute-binding protein [Paenibacillus sp.]
MKRSLAISVSLMIAFLTACSGAGNGGDPAQTPSESADQPAAEGEGGERVDPFGKYEETVTFTTGRRTIANHNLPEGDTLENNGYSRYVLSRINVKVESAWEVDPSTYAEKVALSISSGDIPDVMLVDRKTFKQMLDAGVLEDLTDAFNDALAPSIRDFYDSYGGRLLSQTTIDGKIMGIPGTQLGGGHNMLWIRQDWLDRLGLEPPKTLDDVIAVAKAFMEKDPGGNGPGQTVGLVASSTVAGIYNSMLGLDTIFTLYGAYPKQWIRDASGNVVYGSTTPEMKEALRKLSEMYQSGIIDKEFALRKADDANALLASGKAGLMFGAWWAPYWPLSDTIKNNPKADWRPYLAPLDEGGKLKIYTQDPVNEILVVRKGYPHPEAIVKVLNAENELHFGWEGITPEGVKIKKEMHGK